MRALEQANYFQDHSFVRCQWDGEALLFEHIGKCSQMQGEVVTTRGHGVAQDPKYRSPLKGQGEKDQIYRGQKVHIFFFFLVRESSKATSPEDDYCINYY